MKPVLCFGEVLLRLIPTDHLRFAQCLPGQLSATFAGAEVNAAVAIAQLGGNSKFLTALPDNAVARACVAQLRAQRVDVDAIRWLQNARMGVFFIEFGAGMRGGDVVYDRDHSAFQTTPPEAYPWDELLADVGHFHTSGITPAVSANTAAIAHAALKAAKAKGIPTSYDINHRRKLWRWDTSLSADALAKRTHLQNLPFIDILIGNPFDLAALLDNPPAPDALEPDETSTARMESLAEQVAAHYPHLKRVVVTLRKTYSSNTNGFGALMYTSADRTFAVAPRGPGGAFAPHRVEDIVDRVGTGDAFAGALLRALYDQEAFPTTQAALDYAVAAGALAHTVQGDYAYLAHAEVLALTRGTATAHLSR